VTKSIHPRPLNEAERAARRRRIVRVAKRQGLVDVEQADGPDDTSDDDDGVDARDAVR